MIFWSLRNLVENDLGARRRDDDVAERFHRRRAVDVGERDMIGMGSSKGRELVRRTAVLEAATGVHVGQDYRLLGRQDLRRLGHEADAAKGDHLGIRLSGLARQIETVADEVREVLDFGLLVIMREDYGVALALQALDLAEEVEPLETGVSERSFLPLSAPFGVPLPVSPAHMGSKGRDRKRRRSRRSGSARQLSHP